MLGPLTMNSSTTSPICRLREPPMGLFRGRGLRSHHGVSHLEFRPRDRFWPTLLLGGYLIFGGLSVERTASAAAFSGSEPLVIFPAGVGQSSSQKHADALSLAAKQ